MVNMNQILKRWYLVHRLSLYSEKLFVVEVDVIDYNH